MEGKFIWALCAVLAVSAARTFPLEDTVAEVLEIPEFPFYKIDPRLLENIIQEKIKKFRDFLKNGNPEKGIPPVDPYFLSEADFDFIIRDTELKGSFEKTTISNFSNFEIPFVKLAVLHPGFDLEIELDKLNIDGRYELLGNFFNEIPVNGTGVFISETSKLLLKLGLRLTTLRSRLQIKDLTVESKILSEKIWYTNELVDNKMYELDEGLVLYVLDRVQERYLPLLTNLVKTVVNDFLLEHKFRDLLRLILSLLTRRP